jgi:anaerobic selenocysteine-containing dehydrogenase
LQGFYQSHQATPAAVQVNNIHLIRGMLGKPGCGVLQMNGQPSAQNTRECGADGDVAGFRNGANDEHIAELARLWDVEPHQIPHHGPPTHAMQTPHNRCRATGPRRRPSAWAARLDEYGLPTTGVLSGTDATV